MAAAPAPSEIIITFGIEAWADWAARPASPKKANAAMIVRKDRTPNSHVEPWWPD